MLCEKILGVFNFLKRLLPLLPGVLILISINYWLCLKEPWLCINNPYLQISWLFVCFLVFILSIGVDKFSFGAGSLQITLEKAKATQHELEGTLGVVMKILARIADSNSHQNLLPCGGRTYMYNLIHKILSNSFYSEADKNELIRDCKWVLLKWLFSQLEMELKSLSNPALTEKLYNIKKELKNILNIPKYDFLWIRNEIINLKDKNILNNLSEGEKKKYSGIVKSYQRIIEDFIYNSTIPEEFLTTGEREPICD